MFLKRAFAILGLCILVAACQKDSSSPATQKQIPKKPSHLPTVVLWSCDSDKPNWCTEYYATETNSKKLESGVNDCLGHFRPNTPCPVEWAICAVTPNGVTEFGHFYYFGEGGGVEQRNKILEESCKEDYKPAVTEWIIL
jgi:hypothetical protein